MAKFRGAAVCFVLVVVVLAGKAVAADDDGGRFETTVFQLVSATIRGNSIVAGDPRVGPALIRLLFHDCWGCDGSVLLDETPADGTATEKTAAKGIGLGGFDVIDRIKAELLHAGDANDADASCADILAFAARDAVAILSGGRIRYAVRRGRGDGVTSSADVADAALPSHAPSGGFAELEANFAARGFGKGDLAALAGAHGVSVSHAASFADRLAPSLAATGQINGTYQLALCARQKQLLVLNSTVETTPTESMTMSNNVRDTEPAFRAASSYSGVGVDMAAINTLDNSYYTANLQNMVLLKSDWELTQDEDSLARLVQYRDDGDRWSKDFGNAMERLSDLRPPMGVRLEVRKNCRLTNLSPGRAVVHAIKRFLQRRYNQMSCLLNFFNAGFV